MITSCVMPCITVAHGRQGTSGHISHVCFSMPALLQSAHEISMGSVAGVTFPHVVSRSSMSRLLNGGQQLGFEIVPVIAEVLELLPGQGVNFPSGLPRHAIFGEFENQPNVCVELEDLFFQRLHLRAFLYQCLGLCWQAQATCIN